ncbi:MAG: substrate-binding domain-containing protein [Dorea formicigenerans]
MKEQVSGKVVVGGSSSISPVMEKLVEGYKAVNRKADFELQTTDSTTGMTSAMDGSYDIGMASRELKDDGAVHRGSEHCNRDRWYCGHRKQRQPTDEMSTEQVKSIYTGDASILGRGKE